MASRLPKPVSARGVRVRQGELVKRGRQKSAPDLKSRSGSLDADLRSFSSGIPMKHHASAYNGACYASTSSTQVKPAASGNNSESGCAKAVSMTSGNGLQGATVSEVSSLSVVTIIEEVIASQLLLPERAPVKRSLAKTFSDATGTTGTGRGGREPARIDGAALFQGSPCLGLACTPDSTVPKNIKPPTKSHARRATRLVRPRGSTTTSMTTNGTLSECADSPCDRQGPNATDQCATAAAKRIPFVPECLPGAIRARIHSRGKPVNSLLPHLESPGNPVSYMSVRAAVFPPKASASMRSLVSSAVPRLSKPTSLVEAKTTCSSVQSSRRPAWPRRNCADRSSSVEEEFSIPVIREGSDQSADQRAASLECDNCDFEVHSMFGIKKSRHSIHTCYKIGRIIGDGNFAVVRECRNRKTQKSFALKIISKSKVKGKEHMIENEILILRRIRHKNIVELIEEFETPKEIFLVMELVEGGDLFDAIVANTRFPEHESAHMIRDLASAVDYLHSLSIVHRDIKPENLLVVNKPDGSKALKLADFGLSIEVKSVMFLVCGTPTYVAPEILEEGGYGLKVDIWAIGVICYILLCGFPPFRSSNHDQEELFDKILRGDYEYLAPFWDDICDDPRDLIDHLLVVDVNMRYDAKDILGHFWIEKWTRPSEKIHRELSEEANLHNRKRLRGVALAIQSVIGLLYAVREKNALAALHARACISTSSQVGRPEPTIKSIAGLSRIPRPRLTPGVHIAEIRKAITAPIRRQQNGSQHNAVSHKLSVIHPKPAPEYSLRKGFLKRDEAIRRELRRNRLPFQADSSSSPRRGSSLRDNRASATNVQKPVPTASTPSRLAKFRPLSVVEIREGHADSPCRPSSAHSPRARATPRTLSLDCSRRPMTAPSPKAAPKDSSKARSSDVVHAESDVVSHEKLFELLNIRSETPGNSIALSDRLYSKAFVVPQSINEPHGCATMTASYSSSQSTLTSDLHLNPERASRNLSSDVKSAKKRPSSLSLSPVFGDPTDGVAGSVADDGAFYAALLAEMHQEGEIREQFSSQTCRKRDQPSSTFTNADDNTSLPSELVVAECKSCTASTSVVRKLVAAGRGSTVASPTMSPRSSPVKTYASVRKSSVAPPAILRSPLASAPVRRASSVEPAPNRRWSLRTKPEKKHASSSIPHLLSRTLSNTKSVVGRNPTVSSNVTRNLAKPHDCNDIKIVTETKKRRNIKFPSGKTVDKETKTKTTVSLNRCNAADKISKDFSGTLLKRMKKLTLDIENLTQPEVELQVTSDSSSESLAAGRSASDKLRSTSSFDFVNAEAVTGNRSCSDLSSGHTDRFSETEYLSLSNKRVGKS